MHPGDGRSGGDDEMRRRLVSFDWALKRLLRSKANFEVLEGFLTELLRQEVKIIEVLESESNKETGDDRFNRVDLKVRLGGGEIVIVEVQAAREYDFLKRLLYASSKVVTEHMYESMPYSDVARVISVSVLYFDLGRGEDYVYRGRTVFRGLHGGDELELDEGQRRVLGCTSASEVFPEYYLIRVDRFDDVARDGLDEWIYFLKNQEVPEGCRAKGLEKAGRVFEVLALSPDLREEYEVYLAWRRKQESLLRSARIEGQEEGFEEGLARGLAKGREKGIAEGLAKGREKGIAEGLAKGREEGLAEGLEKGIAKGREEGIAEGIAKGRRDALLAVARNLLATHDDAQVARLTGLSAAEVARLRRAGD